jgi:hypothetical protein
MKNLILLVLLAMSAGVLSYTNVAHHWRSLERMGERRVRALSHPPKEILVGICWPFAANQDGMGDGLQLALDEINAGGLSGGITVRLVVRDDGFDWEKAKRIALEFSDNPDMSAVLGYYDDSEAIKASTIYESSRLLHLIVGANNTTMTATGFNYIVRTILSSDKIARALAALTVERGHRKVALIWEEGGYGEDLAYQYEVSLDAMNTPLVYQWSYARERADFRLPVSELRGVDADLIVFAGLEPLAGDFLRMTRAVGIKTEILGPSAIRPRCAGEPAGRWRARCSSIFTTWTRPALKTRRSFASSGRVLGGSPTRGPRRATTRCTSWRKRSRPRVPPTPSICPIRSGTWIPGKGPMAVINSTAGANWQTSPFS